MSLRTPARGRRAATLCLFGLGLFAAPALTACSNEGPLAPSAPAKAVAPRGDANNTGFIVGWGVKNGPPGAPTSGVAGHTTDEVGATPSDTAVVVEAQTSAPVVRR